jgi:hypothetical protein
MEGIASGLVRERHGEEPALQRLSRNDEAGSLREIETRLLLAPGRSARRERLEAERRRRSSVTDVAASVAHSLREEDGLDPGTIELEVERALKQDRREPDGR